MADEIESLLAALRDELSAHRVGIAGESQVPKIALRCPLGMNRFLYVIGVDENARRAIPAEQVLLQCARALRALGRVSLPTCQVPKLLPDLPVARRELIGERIREFLRALAAEARLAQVLLVYHGELVESASEASEEERERIPLLARQLELAGKQSTQSSHGELLRDDLYAKAFWHAAGLFGFYTTSGSAPALDFLRFRFRQVSRELTPLLQELDDPTQPPAKIAPVP